MKHPTHYPLDELKLVYRVLHANLMQNVELLDSTLLSDLQRTLQVAAQAEGVDLTDHAAWDAWLGLPPVPCSVRMDARHTPN